MKSTHALALTFDPTLILAAQGLQADPWQRDLLLANDSYLLLNCARQSGKSTTTAALALHQILTVPGSLVLLVAPSERQSHELFRKVHQAYLALGQPVSATKANQGELELANGSRLVALPGREETIRSYSGVDLLILDEASRVPDDLYRSVRPMLAVSRGRLLALSTPFGQRGWFHEEWVGSGPWKRLHVPWVLCPRIAADFIAEEMRALGRAWVDQEYNCLFTALEGLVYPEFSQAVVEFPPSLEGRRVGGIDFGWRNPFAAVWGIVDHDGVLWITNERYLRETPISDHAAALPKNVTWYADPAGRTEIEEMRKAGLVVRRGENQIRQGISQVSARLRTGRLRVAPRCDHLLAEAKLYRYPSASERELLGENPVDAHNHALAALRYLVSRLESPRGEKAPIADETPKRENADDADSAWEPIGAHV